jgi:hypothetical protein
MDVRRDITAKRARVIATACAAFALLAASGCGVRCNQVLVDEPLPIAGDGAPPLCQTVESKKAFAAPQWLVRCRRDWQRWRHGEEAKVNRDEFVVPPAPRFHPVPTRPVFAPLEFEAPPGATRQPVADGSKTQPYTEEVPAPVPTAPPAAAPVPAPAKEPPKAAEGASRPLIAPPRLMPRAVTPKAAAASGPALIRSESKPIDPTVSVIPSPPKAEAPLAEEAARPQWRARR